MQSLAKKLKLKDFLDKIPGASVAKKVSKVNLGVRPSLELELGLSITVEGKYEFKKTAVSAYYMEAGVGYTRGSWFSLVGDVVGAAVGASESKCGWWQFLFRGDHVVAMCGRTFIYDPCGRRGGGRREA